MKELEKNMRKQYESYCKKHPRTSEEDALRVVYAWAEEWIMKNNGKLTISSESEIKQILDKFRK
jgi:uncharacterized protein YneF (UPF0154 family)